jgi:hypothetical protein
MYYSMNLGSILCFISWTFFLLDCKKMYLLIMLQVVYKGTFLFRHLNNANIQLIYVWSHAVSVGIHGGPAFTGAKLGCLHIFSFCCWKFKSLHGGFCPIYNACLFIYSTCLYIIFIVLALFKWWQDLGSGWLFSHHLPMLATQLIEYYIATVYYCENDLYYFCLWHNISY